MTVYSNIEIRQAINDDIIVCQPFNPDHVAEASLDFTLGHYYYKQEFEGENQCMMLMSDVLYF